MVAKLVKAYNDAEDAVLAYFFVGLGLLIVVDIAGRRLGVTSFYWLEEFGRYVMIFMTLLGASKAVKERKHLSMNAVVRRLPERWAHLIQGMTDLACCAFLLYVDYYAWKHVVHLHRIGVETSTLGIPFYIPYLPIALFGIGMFVRFFICSMQEFRVFHKEGAMKRVPAKGADFK